MVYKPAWTKTHKTLPMTSINEEIRQLKHYKIQVTEGKIRKYKKVYEDIQKDAILPFSKNTSSYLARIILGMLSAGFFLLMLMSYFPYEIIQRLELDFSQFQKISQDDFVQFLSVFKYVFLFMALHFYALGRLIKKSAQKRNSIYQLSKLVDEVMDDMDLLLSSEKRRYEYQREYSYEAEHALKYQAN